MQFLARSSQNTRERQWGWPPQCQRWQPQSLRLTKGCRGFETRGEASLQAGFLRAIFPTSSREGVAPEVGGPCDGWPPASQH